MKKEKVIEEFKNYQLQEFIEKNGIIDEKNIVANDDLEGEE